MVNFDQTASGIQKVHAAIGDFHIVPTDEYIEQVIAACKEINPDYLIPGHVPGSDSTTLCGSKCPTK